MAMVRPDWRVEAPPVVILALAPADAPRLASVAARAVKGVMVMRAAAARMDASLVVLDEMVLSLLLFGLIMNESCVVLAWNTGNAALLCCVFLEEDNEGTNAAFASTFSEMMMMERRVGRRCEESFIFVVCDSWYG